MKKIIFCGCGGLYNYSLGIAYVLQKRYFNDSKYNKNTNNNNFNNYNFLGISAGVYPAVLLALKLDINTLFNTFNKDFLEQVNKCYLGALFNWYDYARIYTNKYIPNDSYKSSNISISITEINGFTNFENKIIDKWENKEEFMDCIISSGFIPLFGKYLFSYYNNKKCIDGCLTYDYKNKIDTYDTLYIYPSKWRKNINYNWYYCYSDIKWAEQLYKMGIEDAEKNIEYLDNFFSNK